MRGAPVRRTGAPAPCARYWDRTSDLFRVREARYRCANRASASRGRYRADDGTRTRDPHLGKVMLYQLSHVRVSAPPTKDNSTDLEGGAQTETGTGGGGHEVDGRCAGGERGGGAGAARGPLADGVGPASCRRSHGPRCGALRRSCNLLQVRSGGHEGDWRSGSALPSHGRGHWFDPSIAHGSSSDRGACGRGSVGRASPCQGEGRGFESRRPLRDAALRGHLGAPFSHRQVRTAAPVQDRLVGWPRGEATACKAVYTGSNPVPTSTPRAP